MSFPEKGVPQTCSVEGFPGIVSTRTAMRVHFVHRHVLDTMVMLEEGNSLHPRCARCNMQVPRRELSGRHLGTAQCLKGAERKRRRLSEKERRKNLDQAFEAYGVPIKSVLEFKYMGRILTATDNNWPEVVRNLGKLRRSWGSLFRVLGRDSVDPKVSRALYIAVTQAVLLFWVGYVSVDGADGEGPGQLPVQVCEEDHGGH